MKTYLLWIACSLPWLAFNACTSADKCERGEPGCVCMEDDSCGGGAQCVEGTCLMTSHDAGEGGTGEGGSGSGGKGSAGSGGKGGTGGKGGKSDAGVNDAGPKVDAGKDAGGGTKIDCSATTFDDACEAFCEALCHSEEALCVTSRCEAGFCAGGGGQLRDTCDSVCTGKDVACVQDLCTVETERKCEEFGFEDDNGIYQSGCFNEDPACVLNPDFGCSNTCGTLVGGIGADLAGNGQCEDSGQGSISPPSCPRGTDCKDCGTRTCAAQGATCSNAGDCCGFFSDDAYCVNVSLDPSMKDPRCLATCSTEKPCAAGLTCTPLAGSNNQSACVQ